jgi:hypothetical protein
MPGCRKSVTCEKRVKTLLQETAHDHRFLVVGALYFHEIDGGSRDFPPLVVPDCDSVTIRAHWRMTTNCPDSAQPVPGVKRRRKISSGHSVDMPAGTPVRGARCRKKFCLRSI